MLLQLLLLLLSRINGMAMLSMMMLRRKIGPTQTRKVEVYCQKLSEPKNSKSSYQIAFITRTFNSSVLTFVSFNNPFVNSIRLVHNSWRSKKVISLVCSRTACIISIIALINKREREAQWISGTESPYILRLTFRSLQWDMMLLFTMVIDGRCRIQIDNNDQKREPVCKRKRSQIA